MHDRLPPKGVWSWSCDLFKLGEMSDNTLEKVRDKHSCNGSLTRNRMWPIEWHHYR